MAKNTSVLTLRGRVGNLVFSSNGSVSQAPSSRPATAARTLENMAEFGSATIAAKLLNDAFRPYIREARDRFSFGRLSSLMSSIIKKDLVNPRGQRGILDDELIDLKGFEFNKQAGLSSTLYAAVSTSLVRATGVAKVSVAAHSALDAIAAPTGATHYKLVGVAVEIDFSTGETIVKSDSTAELSVTNSAVALTDLEVDVTANSTKTVIFGLGVKFYQSVNTEFYPLQGSDFNSFQLVDVKLA